MHKCLQLHLGCALGDQESVMHELCGDLDGVLQEAKPNRSQSLKVAAGLGLMGHVKLRHLPQRLIDGKQYLLANRSERRLQPCPDRTDVSL